MDRVQGIPTNGDPSGTSEICKLLPPTGLQGAIVLEPVEELEPRGGVTAQRLIEIQPLRFPNCGKTWREQRNEYRASLSPALTSPTGALHWLNQKWEGRMPSVAAHGGQPLRSEQNREGGEGIWGTNQE